MLRKTLTILSLLGLLLSVGLWGVSCGAGWSHTHFYIGPDGEEIGITFICADGRIGWDEPGDMLNSVPYPDYGVSLWLPTVILAGAFLSCVFQKLCVLVVLSIIRGTVRVARRVGTGFGLVARKLRRPLIVFSLTGLLLGAGLWGVSYWSLRLWWPNNRVHLATGKLYWVREAPVAFPYAWRWDGFYGFNLEGLKPRHPRDWFFRPTPPPGHEDWSGGFGPVGFAGPGIGVTWNPSYDANGVRGWDCQARILLWIPTLVCGITLCICRPLSHRRRKRKKLGLCLKCGYNLKGLTKPRCPECNTPFDERLLKKDA